LQANDKRRAYDLLGRAVQLEPHSEQAWLWLSGAVDSAAERRYCLERVLAINPHNAAALRGLAILPPALPVSPAAASARREASEVADPTVVTYMPPPIAAASAPPSLAAGPDRHAL